MMHMDAYIMPTNNIDYKSHRTYLTNRLGSTGISHHITLLVIHSLGGGHTHTHIKHRHSRTEAIIRNQVRAALAIAGTRLV